MKSTKSSGSEEKENNGIKRDFFVVGIGASAGGIQALQELVERIPENPGVAFVVMLHLPPNPDCRLDEMLRRVSKLPVEKMSEEITLLPNKIYIVPSDRRLTMVGDDISKGPDVTPGEVWVPVDIFFRSLGEIYGSRVVAVVLSGAGANGSMGLKRVKEGGGAVYVQNPREAQFNEMPRNAISTGLVDEVLNVADIPAGIIAYRDSHYNIHIPDEPKDREETDQQALRTVLYELRLRTGHDFSNYKQPTLLRRIERRINVRGLEGLPAYASFLVHHQEEFRLLLNNLLISVTNFFRDKKPFEELERNLLPGLLKDKTGEDELRIWVAGCATGEEAYSMAILCAELTMGRTNVPKIQIFATDIDEAAIAVAREGFYTINDAADVPPGWLSHYFVREGEGYRIRRDIRECVLFANHNFLKDSPFSRMDLVSCRNVLIYLQRMAQQRVFETFHFAINPGGFLLLGSSESVDVTSELFSLYNRDCHIWQSRLAVSKSIIVPDIIPRLEPSQMPHRTVLQPRSQERVSFKDMHLQMVELYAPPSVIINEAYDIMHISEHAGRFLKIVGGELTQNLLKLVQEDLRAELRSALFQATQRNSAVSAIGLRFRGKDREETINLHIRPVPEQGNFLLRGYMLVVFESVDQQAPEIPYVVASDEPARQLEEEVVRLKALLSASQEEHDFAAEELKAGNEELQAMNEELRSSSEELEASREELQSINEELSTVNHELRVRIEDASSISNNLRNIINSTNIGTLILDLSLRVLMFTPAARNIFNLISADHTRPLSDITNRLRDDRLLADAEEVLQRLHGIEREMETEDGNTYLTRITPFRTDEDHIKGVVISLVDITARRKAENALRASEEWRRLILESADDYAIFTQDLERRVNSWNIGAQHIFGYEDHEIIGMSGDILFVPEDREKGDAANEAGRALKDGRAENERWHLRKDDSRFWGSGITHPLKDENGKPVGFVKIMRDLTEQRAAEQAQRANEARQTFLVKLGDVLRPLSDAMAIQEAAARFIGGQLGAAKAFYCEMEEDGNHMWIRSNYLNGVESPEGRFQISDFGPFLLEEYRAGRTVVVNEVAQDARLSEAERTAYAAVNVEAFVCVPLVKAGRLVSVLSVNQPVPRNWKSHETNLVEETAQRTWAAMERARAEEALKQSEEKYRMLFDSIDEGFAIVEVLFSESGDANDYRFLETNRAHEEITGIPRTVTGKRIREFIPDIEESLLRHVGSVALTGEPGRYEVFIRALDRWFDVFAVRVGGSDGRRVATVFNNITERKRHEANLAFLAQTSADFSPLASAEGIMERVAGRLGDYLRVSSCQFAVVNEAEDRLEIIYEWRRNEQEPGMLGIHSISANFPEEALRHYREGRLFVVNGAHAGAGWNLLQEEVTGAVTGSVVDVPYVQKDRWKFLLRLTRTEPCKWKEDEMEIVRELASRIYLRIERARAEEALKASEERLQKAVSIETVGVIFFDIDGTIHDANDAFLRMSGYVRNNIREGRVRRDEMTPPEFMEVTNRSKEELLREGKNTPYEKQYIRPDGTRWWGLFAGKRVGENEYVEFVVDITESKQGEQALRESELRLAAVFEALPVGVGFMDTSGTLALFNSEMKRYAPNGIIPSQDDARFSRWRHDLPDGTQLQRSDFPGMRALQGEKVVPGIEMRYLQDDGREIWTQAAAVPIRNAESQITGAITIVSDIDAVKRAAETLQKAHAGTAEILESISDVFFTLDADLRFTYVNTKAEQTWGLARESLLGRKIVEVFPKLKESESERMQLKVLQSREAVQYEAVSPVLNRWISVGIYPSNSGGISVFFHDIEDRKQAEEALRSSEVRAHTLADAIPHVLWTNDGTGFANYFNKRWFEYTGLSVEASMGRGWQAVVHPEDAVVSGERWKQALAEGSVFDTEYRLRRHDGTYRWFIGRNVPVRDENGVIVSWFGSATDIEDLKQAQELLTSSEERLRITVESATDYAIITTDASGIIESWSRGATQMFGYEEQEAKGQHFGLLFAPEDRAAGKPEQEMRQAQEVGFAVNEGWHHRKDGSRIFMSGVVRPIVDGWLRGFVKVASDLTEKKQAEEALRISEERYRIALGSAGMAAWDWDVVGDRIIWNEQHYFIFGLQPDGTEKNAAFFMSFVLTEDQKSVEKALRKAVVENCPYQAEFRIKRVDNGEIRWMSGYGHAVMRDPSGHATRMVGVMHDITARKRVEEQKDEFIGIASHELRTPVTSIKAYTEILQDIFEENGDLENAGLMRKLDEQVDRLTTLIYALLDTTRITEGKLQLQKSDFNIDELILDCTETMQRIAGNQRIELDMKAGITITADHERIRQVLINLISNAIKYAPGTDRIIVQSFTDKDNVTVCVQDFGIGIDEVAQQQIFERFFRSGETNTISGLGLGLYISSTIVRQHGGTITVKSRKGAGSLFCFTIPAGVK